MKKLESKPNNMKTFILKITLGALTSFATATDIQNDFIDAPISNLSSELYSQKNSITQDQINTNTYWDKLELKYDLNRFDGRSHDFEVKLSPTNWWRNQSITEEFSARKEFFNLKSEMLKNDLIQKRYNHLLNKYEIHFKKHWKDSLLKIQRSKQEFLINQSTQIEFDPRELLKNQNKILNLNNDSLELVRRIERWKNRSFELTNDQTLIKNLNEAEFKTNTLLSSDAIIKYLTTLENKEAPKSYSNLLEHQKLKRVLARESSEKIDGNGVLSYVKTGFELEFPKDNTDPINYGKEQWFAGVGIEIPFGNGSYQKLLDKKMDVIEQKTKTLESDIENQEDWNELLTEVKISVEKMNQILSFKQKISEGGLSESIKKWAASNPLLLFETQELLLDSKYELNILHLDILRKYIRLIGLQKKLSIESNQNYLSQLP